MRLDAEATYKPSGDYFSQVNPSIAFDFGKERSIAFGHRYQYKAGKEFTLNSSWRLNPKWKLGVYERYQFVDTPDIRRGLAEQQYSISRDLHCWVMEVVLGHNRTEGANIWLVFRLKAFPEMEFNFNQSFSTSDSGSQQ